jgi:hypothetical protein
MPNAWSAPEVLDHIVRSEAGTTLDVSFGLLSSHRLDSGDRPRVAVLDQLLRSDQTFQVPAGAAAILPSSQITFREVVSRWEDVRTELLSIVQGLSPAAVSGGVFLHPFAGWMTFREVLEHFSSHAYHHGLQLARLHASWLKLQS